MAFTNLTTVANIQSYFQAVTFDSTSSVTDTQVDRFITQGTNIVYGVLRERYAIPDTGITDTEDLVQLAYLCELYVLAQVKPILGPNNVVTIKNDNLKIIKSDQIQFEQTLEKYRQGIYQLNNTGNAGSDKFLHTTSYNQQNCISPQSRKCENIW